MNNQLIQKSKKILKSFNLEEDKEIIKLSYKGTLFANDK